jgi:hypothetical protein
LIHLVNQLHHRPFLASEQLIVGRSGLVLIEAKFNSLLLAETVVGRDGKSRHQLPAEPVVEIIQRYRGDIEPFEENMKE